VAKWEVAEKEGLGEGIQEVEENTEEVGVVKDLEVELLDREEERVAKVEQKDLEEQTARAETLEDLEAVTEAETQEEEEKEAEEEEYTEVVSVV
jgi:putative NADH-flavin reductase